LVNLGMVLNFPCPHPIFLSFVRVCGLIASGKGLLLPCPPNACIQFHPVLRAVAPLRLIAKFFLKARALTDLSIIIDLCLVTIHDLFLTCEKFL
jgi:hypothetical protein